MTPEQEQREACRSLYIASIKQAFDDLSEREHWRESVGFIDGRGLDTFLRAAQIGPDVKDYLRREALLGDLWCGLGSVGIVRINKAQGFGWLYPPELA